MKLSINLVHGGRYVRAGDDLPSDFILPEHLERFAVYDDPSQASRATSHSLVEGRREGSQLAKPATDYREAEEEFAAPMAKEIRHSEEKKGNEMRLSVI